MTPAEVGHRLLRALQARAERSGYLARESIPPAQPAGQFHDFVHRDARSHPAHDAASCIAAANRIADGCMDVFALRNIDLGAPPRWNRDPKTGIEAPLAFGKTLDYRDPDLVGDIKYLWEPNRHAHLVTLAQAYALTRNIRYVQVVMEQLESWFLACPHPRGANWASPLEAAIRLVNWSAAWQLLGGMTGGVFENEIHRRFRVQWLRSVYEHLSFVRGWLSLHSSANHRLIGEAAGLFVGALTWPCWPESRRWLGAAKAILEREALAQNAPDGVNREQSVCTQRFVLDALLLCLLAGKANGVPLSDACEARIEAMLDFLASIMDCGGNLPMLGDSDDAQLLRLSHEEGFSAARSLLATGAILFRRGDFALRAGALDERTRWLLGPSAQAQFAALEARKMRLPPRQQFAEGGYYVLGCEFGTPNEIRLVADAGALGYPSTAAHGHADALAFTLSAGGREFLIDPGTFAYHGQARWRSYFRGTAAHSTLRVDGLDQSEPGGDFLWLRKARAGCSLWLSSAQKDTFEGWHDGYMRLPDPVKHRRLIALDKSARRVLVEDTLEMEEEHEVELLFHCSEECTVEALPEGFCLARGDLSIRIDLPQVANATSLIYSGSIAPIFGWVSREFDRRQPAPTIVWRARLAGNTVLRTQIAVRKD